MKIKKMSKPGTSQRIHNCIIASLFLLYTTLFIPIQAGAATVDLYDFTSHVYSGGYSLASAYDERVNSGFGFDLGAAHSGTPDLGLDFQFQSNLDAYNFGTLNWRITNNGSTLNNVKFLGALGALTSSDSFGDAAGLGTFTSGLGSTDIFADSWEIDDAYSGDTVNNLLSGSLDNSVQNIDTEWGIINPTLALGFDLGTLESGQVIEAVFHISSYDNGGLHQWDPDPSSSNEFWLNGSATVNPVPLPSAIFMLAPGIIGLIGIRRRKSLNV